MAKLEAITLPNGLATPANVAFRVASQVGTTSTFRANISPLLPSEQPTVTMGFRPESSKLPQKVSTKVTVPPTSAEKLAKPTADDIAVFIQVVSKENADPARINDAIAYAIGFIKTPIALEAIKDGLAPF